MNIRERSERKMTVIDMLAEIKDKFPGIFTGQGKLRKRAPYKYKCECGSRFSNLTTTRRFAGLVTGTPICGECGRKGRDNLEFNVWKRMVNGQIEQEDFILNQVKERGYIEKGELEGLLQGRFTHKTDALGTLVYFGYLCVDERKRDYWGMVEYRINSNKKLDVRYELVR